MNCGGTENVKSVLENQKFYFHLTLERNWHRGAFSLFNTVRKCCRSLSRLRKKKKKTAAEHSLRDGADDPALYLIFHEACCSRMDAACLHVFRPCKGENARKVRGIIYWSGRDLARLSLLVSPNSIAKKHIKH